MEDFDSLWTRLVPGETNGTGIHTEGKGGFGPAREYAAAATYEWFSHTCRRRESARIFRELAEKKRQMARRLMTEEYLRSGVRGMPIRPLYERPTLEALRGMYHYERETAEYCSKEEARHRLALEAAEQLRLLLEMAMP